MEPCYNDTSNKGVEDNYSYAMELASSSVLPMVLMAAVELKVLDIIAKACPGAQLSPSEIASRLPAATRNPDTPESWIGCYFSWPATRFSRPRSSSISSDQPPPPLAARLDQQRRLFGLSAVANYFVSDQDVGGVSSMLFLLQAGQGIHGRTAGVEHVGGDMFESVPKGDAIFMKAILHDWSDDQCLKLLKNCRKALPDNVKIIVVEGILPVIPDSSAATKGIFQFDLVMMTQNVPWRPGRSARNRSLWALLLELGFLASDLNALSVTFGSWNFATSTVCPAYRLELQLALIPIMVSV